MPWLPSHSLSSSLLWENSKQTWIPVANWFFSLRFFAFRF